MNNLLLKFMNLLGSNQQTSDASKTGIGWLDNIIDPLKGIINAIIVPLLIIVATVGIIYAIVLGVNYAKAESSDQKEEAKKRIINVVVGAVLMIVLMLLLYLFINNAHTIVGWISETAKPAGSN